MKKFIILMLTLTFSLSVFAEVTQTKNPNFPQGTFKKNRNGQIIQYDSNGKKLGVYKVTSGRFIKVK